MIRMVQDSGIVGLAGMVFNCSMFSQNPGQPPPLENQVTFELFTVNVQHCNFVSILPMLDLSGCLHIKGLPHHTNSRIRGSKAMMVCFSGDAPSPAIPSEIHLVAIILSRIKRVNSRCLRCSDSKIKHSLEGKRCSPRVLEITRFQYFRNSVLQFWR
ncbi:hypothetical protein BDL97_15G029300 [Sphagnum fallax]|nr:hypothetical protein BDL97_15G029300 [Sphagnum fallax]